MRNECGILIVDDDAAFAALVETVLREAGFRCRTAASGEAALAAADADRPGIVLLDVHMPEMSGYDVCRRLRNKYGRSLGIIFISGGRTESYDQVAGLELGADDYLSKPFDPGLLVARVRALVRRLQPAESRAPQREESGHPLTAREVEVLTLMAEGWPQKRVAERLAISRKTVGTHVSHIFEKLGVHNQVQAVAAGQRLHLLGAPIARRALGPRATPAATAALLGLPYAAVVEIFGA